MSTEPAGVKECWEAAVSADTPYWRDHLRTLEDEAAEMNRTVGHLLKLSQGYTKAAEAMAIARKELMQGVLTAATDSFQHADLSSDASAKQVAEMGSLFDQMIVAHDMERQQVQSLLVEPLQAMLDDPKGLASGSRLYAAYNSMSHDFYEALSEFLSLEGEGANAMAARAHAKTQAKAAAKVGSAAMSAAASKVGTGFGFLSRMAQNKLGDLGLTGPGVDAPAAAEEEEERGSPVGPSVGDAAREALSGVKNAGNTAVQDAEGRVLRQQDALVKTRHAMEVRLLDTTPPPRATVAAGAAAPGAPADEAAASSAGGKQKAAEGAALDTELSQLLGE